MTSSGVRSFLPRVISALALVGALGAATAGCGPKEKFCANAPEDHYRCLMHPDAQVQDAPPEAPPKSDAPIIIPMDDSGVPMGTGEMDADTSGGDAGADTSAD
jgi:hypothetical protein